MEIPEEPHTLLGLAFVFVVSIVALLRDTGFQNFLIAIKQKRSEADEKYIKLLEREKDITEAFMEMVEDDTLVIKYKTLQRVMRTHKNKKEKN